MSAVQVRLWPPLLAFVFVAAGCGDRCDSLCNAVSVQLEACVDESPVTWQDYGATGRLDWVQQCRVEWEAQRSALTAREIELALDECRQAQPVVFDLTCDEVEALYAP